ncbi:hypothetical protein [Dokdonella immobilis]|uniref:Uncharacterized protein n=1 Tax=Dokdonella immobilis TaxID=578942 RepID=A0A1I4XHJ9_9GAMM|nr:hypothetical protein [Dokdonella immobilis]SFN25341.1 hypothetical protein SAMN05216289_11023 [Dokdonella immobilis]
MLSSDVPNKTTAGYAEIQDRKLHLGARQRMLLISIDGAHSVQQVREQFSVLGDVSPLIEELRAAGLIHFNGRPANTLSPVDSAAPPAAPQAEPTASNSMHVIPPIGLVRQFMNETTVAALGLRAFMFTLKLERANSKAELSDLVPEYKRLLAKSSKSDPAYPEAMARRIEQMLSSI